MTTESTRPRPSNRTIYTGLWVLAGLVYGLLIVAQQPFGAVAAFVGLGLAAIVYRIRFGRPLFDERDYRLRQRGADLTLRIIGIASAVFFPTVVILWGLGYHEWPPWLFYLGIYVAALTGLYGGSTLFVRSQG